MTTPNNPPLESSKTTSTIQIQQAMLANSGLVGADQVDALLDSAARRKTLLLGAALNSEVHQALLDMSREVWSLAESILTKRQ